MFRERFYHEVISPFVRLKVRALQNVCVQSQHSDIVALAQEAALAAYHFPENARGRASAMRDSAAENLRQMLGDVSNTKKHGVLDRPERQVQLSSCLAYEFNEAGQFKYLGTQVWAENARFGSFEVIKTVEAFLPFVRREFEVDLELTIEIPNYEFCEVIETYVTAATFYAKDVRLRFYAPDGGGNLLPKDPSKFELRVYDLSSGKEVFRDPNKAGL